MRRLPIIACAAISACTAPERDVETFAAAPATAAAVVADCDAGRTRRECDAARRGLAEARRRARMDAYERAF